MNTITNKKLVSLKDENKLNNYVIDCILSEDKENRINYIENVLQYGCVSGIVSELTYYFDTTKFFETYKVEINKLLFAMYEMTGMLYENFGGKFDYEDLLCLEQTNQNLLAWFSYEETIRNIAYNLGMEI